MNQYTEDIQHIRKMMEKSTQFLSLSGLSGIAAGITAMLSSAGVFYIFKKNGINYFDIKTQHSFSGELLSNLVILALITIVVAIVSVSFFTIRKLKDKNLPVYNSSTRKFLVSLFMPLLFGGIFCVALTYNGQIFLVAPAMLVFYGLALINASKYTHNEIFWLGILEALLGLLASFFTGYGLVFWATGFGVLHISYGIIIHQKYR